MEARTAAWFISFEHRRRGAGVDYRVPDMAPATPSFC